MNKAALKPRKLTTAQTSKTMFVESCIGSRPLLLREEYLVDGEKSRKGTLGEGLEGEVSKTGAKKERGRREGALAICMFQIRENNYFGVAVYYLVALLTTVS
jgi:hypothetical protein